MTTIRERLMTLICLWLLLIWPLGLIQNSYVIVRWYYLITVR